MTNDSRPRHPSQQHQSLAARDAERQRRATEARELEAKAAARASLQGEEQALQNQTATGRKSTAPPNADEAPRQAKSGTMRPAIGEKRASPDETETRYQSEQNRRGE